jgi:uncharacterized repeat protein (TIGR03803 family)
VFRISPSGTETTLYSFVGYPTDGEDPTAGLVQGSDGNFYGTTYARRDERRRHRVSDQSQRHRNESSLLCRLPHRWANPNAGLVQGSDGNFYGTTTSRGGTNHNGTVFRISPSGTYTSLYSFAGSPTDGKPFHMPGWCRAVTAISTGRPLKGGRAPIAATAPCFGSVPAAPTRICTPLLASPTMEPPYPSRAGAGQRWQFLRDDRSRRDERPLRHGVSDQSQRHLHESVLLWQLPHDGVYPSRAGPGQRRQFLRDDLSPSGIYTSLYSFGSQPNDGTEPLAGLVQGSDGNFYGTTYSGGTNNGGTVFKLSVPPNPVPLCPPPYPINQITNVQVVAQNIIFGIPSIAGEIYQLQFTTDLTSGNWINEGGSITSIGALLTLTNFGGASLPQGFYRFAITP